MTWGVVVQVFWGNNLETRVLLGCNLETVAWLEFCWCVNVNVPSAFTCGRLSGHGCSSRPQVRPPRGESGSRHSPLIVVIQSLPILRREHRGERKKSIYFKFCTQLQDTYWKRKRCHYSPCPSCIFRVYFIDCSFKC